MLNPNWNKYDYSKDLATWRKLEGLISDQFRFMPGSFFEEHEKTIARLYDDYYRTNGGGGTDPNRAIRQKWVILEKDNTFGQLEQAIDNAAKLETDQWNANQLRDESLDAKLEREKVEASIRISKRDKI